MPLGPFGDMLLHRGITHSIFFGPVCGPLLGYAVWRHYERKRSRQARRAASRAEVPAVCGSSGDPADDNPLACWIGLFVLALLTHPLIDVFTSYGTQLLAPFSSRRYALDAVGIIDPFYSGILVAALFAAVFLRGKATAIRCVSTAALALSWTYLGYGVVLNERAREFVRADLAAAGITDARVTAYPTLLQPYLRRVVVRTDGEIRIGLYTPWREQGAAWSQYELAPPHPAIDALLETREGAIFAWFAMGELNTRLSQGPDGVIVEIDDLRYGSIRDPRRGYWGIRGEFDAQGRLREPVQIVEHGPEMAASRWISAVWRAAWGDFSALGSQYR